MMGLPLTWSNTARLPYCSHCTKSFASAGKKELYHRTRGTPKSLPHTITRPSGTTVTSTEASHYSALSATYLLGSYWYASIICRSVSTRSHNVLSELNGQQCAWSCPFDSYKISAEKSRCPCTLLSLISLRCLIWSAETISLRFFQRCVAYQITEHEWVFPHGHEGNSAVQWQLLGAIRNPRRRQTRLCPCSNGLWNCLWPVAKTFVRHSNQMTGSSTSSVSEPRQRYTRFSQGTCCLPVKQQFATHTREELQSLLDCLSHAST